MNLPQSLKIGGHEYKILYPYNFKERVGLTAQSDNSLHEIRVCSIDECGNLKPDSNIMVSFLHELIHSIDKVYCSNRLEHIGRDDCERIVEGLSEGLYQVLHDNGLTF